VALLLGGAAACGDTHSTGGDDDVSGPDAAATIDATPAPPDADPPDAAPPDAPPLQYDCDALPAGPLTLVPLGGQITASEDLAFDAEGNLVGANDSVIFRSRYDGTRTPFVTLSFRAGMRFDPAGNLMVNDDSLGRLVRVEPDRSQYTVLSGLTYPNGMEVGMDGYVYLTEQSAGRVRRIHPITGEATVLTTGVSEPNGLTFNEDYTALYIGSFCGTDGTIFKLPIGPDGTPGTLEPWATGVGTGCLDGMGVDACGNLYVADYGASHIYRISKDGLTKRVIIDESGTFTYMPNMQWGSGVGGWDPMKLYIPEGWSHGVFEVDVGVPSKPRVYP
jgi:sugar lactone lactonase YvrE